jgi:hypothetical protein
VPLQGAVDLALQEVLDVREQLAADRGELVVEDRVTGEKTRVEDAGEDGVVGCASSAVSDGARAQPVARSRARAGCAPSRVT